MTVEQRSRFAWWASVRSWVAVHGVLSRRQFLLSLIPIFGFTGLLSSAELPVFVAVPLVLPLACLAAIVFALRLPIGPHLRGFFDT